MRVKIFRRTDDEALERDINVWLSENGVAILHIGQSEVAETEDNYANVTISVWYAGEAELKGGSSEEKEHAEIEE